jgi:hypothetical protein
MFQSKTSLTTLCFTVVITIIYIDSNKRYVTVI